MRRRSAAFIIVGLMPPAAPAHAMTSARLCIDRPEQEGNRNAMPVSVTVRSKLSRLRRLEFEGGGIRKCTVAPVGDTSVVLRFTPPDLGSKRHWEKRMSIRMHQGENLFTLDVSKDLGEEMDAPHWDETGWHSMWHLVRRR